MSFTRCHPEEAESFAARRAPDEGLCIADDSSVKTLLGLGMRFPAGLEPTLHVGVARNA